MQTTQIKRLLEALAEHTSDASTKKEIENILKEINSQGEGQTPNSDQLPKQILKKVLDLSSRFFIKLAEFKVIRMIWKAIEDLLDDHPHH